MRNCNLYVYKPASVFSNAKHFSYFFFIYLHIHTLLEHPKLFMFSREGGEKGQGGDCYMKQCPICIS